MTPQHRPSVHALADATVVPAAEAPTGTSLARLITHAETGSDVIFGLSWMDPGQSSTSWSLEPPSGDGVAQQEIYYVLRGAIEIDWDEGTLRAGPETAVHLAPGWTYRVRAVSDEPVAFAYTYAPAA